MIFADIRMALLVGSLVVAQTRTLGCGTTLPGGTICVTTVLLPVLQHATLVTKHALTATNQTPAIMLLQVLLMTPANAMVMEHFSVFLQNPGAKLMDEIS